MREQDRRKAVVELLKQQLSAGKEIHLQAISNSMHPFIRRYDQVVVKSTKGEELSPGDVVLFDNSSSLFSHRFIRRLETNNKILLITKGDRLIGFDQPFSEDKLLGKVVAIKRQEQRIDLEQPKYKIISRLLGKIFGLQYLFILFIKTHLSRTSTLQ